MKTAIQEVFSDLEKLHPNLFNIYTSEGKEFVNYFHKYLEIEKQQIIEAHGDKLKKSKDAGNYEYWFTGKDYYNKTFKNTENEKNNN
jgi:hypothetical protein